METTNDCNTCKYGKDCMYFDSCNKRNSKYTPKKEKRKKEKKSKIKIDFDELYYYYL